MRRCGVDFKRLRSQSWWLVSAAALRAALAASVLIALHFLLPLDLGDYDTSTFVKLAFGVVVFLGLMTWQVRAITHSNNPGLRALEALGLAVPLFLLVFDGPAGRGSDDRGQPGEMDSGLRPDGPGCE
jgi:hypothetical protein